METADILSGERLERKLSEKAVQRTETEQTVHELEEWVRVCVKAAEDKLGKETNAFYVGDVLGISEWFVVTSGSSDRQVGAIVEEIEDQLTIAGGPKPVRIEGKSQLNWVLMDYGMLVVHVFHEDARAYFDLDRLWSDVPKLDLEKTPSANSAERATA